MAVIPLLLLYGNKLCGAAWRLGGGAVDLHQAGLRQHPIPMVHPDVWIPRDDAILAVAGLLLAGSHVAFAMLIVLWFALRKPTSWALFKLRLRAAWKRQPLPERLPNYVPQVAATWHPSDLPPSKLWP